MHPSRVQRSPLDARRTIGLGSWSAKSVIVALVFVVVVGWLAMSAKHSRDRAEGWHRRAVAAEEIANGLRVVIGERSRALNQRTVQANVLVTRLDSTRAALSKSKVSVGTLTRRQRQLATENALADAERRKLQKQQAALVSVASAFGACNQGLGAVIAASQSGNPKAMPANAKSRLAKCSGASASLGAYLERFR